MPAETSLAVDKKIISRYINSFRIEFSKYLKEGVGLQASVYPYPTGAIIIIEVGFDLPAKDTFRSEATSLEDAMRRTNLFDEDSSRKNISDAFIVLHKNKIILIKTDSFTQWEQAQVESDVDTILKSIKSEK